MPTVSARKKTKRGRPNYRELIFGILSEGLNSGELGSKESLTRNHAPARCVKHVEGELKKSGLPIDQDTIRKWVKVWLLQWRDPGDIKPQELQWLRKVDPDASKNRNLRRLPGFFRERSEREKHKSPVPTGPTTTTTTTNRIPWSDPIHRRMFKAIRRAQQEDFLRRLESVAKKFPFLESQTEKFPEA